MLASRIFPQLQPLLCQVLLDGLKQHLAQSMTSQQVRGVGDGGRGWHRGATDTGKQMLGTSKVGYEAWRRMRIGWRCWLICQFAACPVL